MRAGGLASLLLAATGAGAEPPHYLEDDAAVADVFAVIDARLALMPEVAAAKWASSSPVADPSREAAVVERIAALAAAEGLEPAPVATLWRLQARLARAVQADLHERWRREPPPRALPAPSLATDLRPRIDALDRRLVRALYLAAPVLGREAFAGRYAPRARGWLPDTRFPESDRAEVVAALAATRFARPPSIARARAAGALRIGTPGDYAPFSVETAGALAGADIELAVQLAAALGLEPVFIRTTWRQLLDDLGADRFDIAVGGISVTSARLRLAAFSVPTASGGKTAIGRCDGAERLASLAAIDQPAVRVVVNPGGTNEQFVRDTLHHAAVRVHPDNRTIFEELLERRADVMLTDDTEVALQIHRHPALCRLLPESYQRAQKAFLLPPAADFEAAINAWLQPRVADGTAARLLEEAERR